MLSYFYLESYRPLLSPYFLVPFLNKIGVISVLRLEILESSSQDVDFVLAVFAIYLEYIPRFRVYLS